MIAGACASCGAPLQALVDKPKSLSVVVLGYQSVAMGLYRGSVTIALPELGMMIHHLRHLGVPGEAVSWPVRKVVSQADGYATPAPRGRKKAAPSATRKNDGGWVTEPIIEFLTDDYRARWDATVETAINKYLQEAR